MMIIRQIFNRVSNLISKCKYHLSKSKVLIYKGAVCRKSVLKGHNTLFNNTTVIGCEIGEYSYIQKDSQLLNTKIGKYCSIADHVITGFGSHPTEFVSTYPSFYYDTTQELGFTIHSGKPKIQTFKTVEGGDFLVEIGNDVWIGSHVLIMDGVSIGDGAIIAAGAVVTKDVEPYAIYGGVPARLIRYRFAQDSILKFKEIRWWDKDIDWIKKNSFLFSDLYGFLNVCKETDTPSM